MNLPKDIVIKVSSLNDSIPAVIRINNKIFKVQEK
jgi:hypothetical protein